MSSSTPDALWASPSVRLSRPAAVEVRGLWRSAPGDGGLHGITLSLPVGARALVVSEPAAASSLLLRVLAGLVRPSAGMVRLAGLGRGDNTSAGWARRVAYVGPDAQAYAWLSPLEVLQLAARLAELDPALARRRVDAGLDRFGLRAAARRPLGRSEPAVGQLVGLAAATLSDPEVLLLDEPLRSVDEALRRRLLRVAGRRVTMLLASRYPAAEEGIVDQVAFIRGGRVALRADVNELAARRLPLSLRGIGALAEMRDAEAAPLRAPPGPRAASG